MRVTALLESIFVQLKEMTKVLKEIRNLLNKMNEGEKKLKKCDMRE